jgi:hypothetical protein
LRIAAAMHLVSDPDACHQLSPVGAESILLLGESTGQAESDHRTRFEFKPERYRRARLCYPGQWSKGQRCALLTARFQPPTGAAIACWQALQAVAG